MPFLRYIRSVRDLIESGCGAEPEKLNGPTKESFMLLRDGVLPSQQSPNDGFAEAALEMETDCIISGDIDLLDTTPF